MTFGIIADTDATRQLTSMRAFAENNSSVWKSATASSSSDALKTVRYSFRPYRFLGLKYKDDVYSAAVVSTPVEEAYIGTFALADAALPQGPQQYNHKIVIDYWVEFFQPKDIALS